MDYALDYKIEIGFLALDQEKAFDRVDPIFLLDALKAFVFFISMIRLLYTEGYMYDKNVWWPKYSCESSKGN